MLNLDYLAEIDNKNPTYVSRCAQIAPTKKYDVKIPKIIMQTWKTHTVPDHWKVSPESISGLMPDWEYVLMDNTDNRAFIEEHFPDFLPYYDDFPYDIQRADAIRYAWLYVHGGIYMDLDFEVLHPLDELFISDAEVYLVHSGNVGSYVTNSFMASKPRSKFWLDVMEEMKKPLPWYYLGKHFVVMCSTGPMMLSRVSKKTRIVTAKLPNSRIMPCNICNIECYTCDSFLKPLEGSSWIGWDTMFYNFWLCHWKKVVGFVICILLLLIIAWIVYKMGISRDRLWPPWKALFKSSE